MHVGGYSALLTQGMKFDCLNRVVKHHLKRLLAHAPKAPRSPRGPVSEACQSHADIQILQKQISYLQAMRSSPRYDKIRTRDILTTLQIKRDLRSWCVKLVRKVYLKTLQTKNDDFGISLTDTLKFILELILNFISKIQRGTWDLKLYRQKLNTRVAQNVDKILDLYMSSVNSYRRFR